MCDQRYIERVGGDDELSGSAEVLALYPSWKAAANDAPQEYILITRTQSGSSAQVFASAPSAIRTAIAFIDGLHAQRSKVAKRERDPKVGKKA